MQVNNTQKHSSALAPPTGSPGLAAPLAEGDSSSGSSDKPDWLVALQEIGKTAPDVIDAFKGGNQPSMEELMNKYPGLFQNPGGGGGGGGQQTAGMGTSTMAMVGLGILGAGGIGYAVATS